MQKGLTICHWLGVELKIEPRLFVLIPLLVLTLSLRVFPYFYADLSGVTYGIMGIVTAFGYLASLVAHEWAHLKMARRSGPLPKSLELSLFGAKIPLDLDGTSRAKRVELSLVGLLFTLAMAAVLFVLSFLSDVGTQATPVTGTLFHLACANLTLGFFQILPALPLDGGKALLDALSATYKGRERALKWVYYSGTVTAMFLMASGIYYAGQNWPIVGGWLVVLSYLLFKANREEYRHLSWRLGPKPQRKYGTIVAKR